MLFAHLPRLSVSTLFRRLALTAALPLAASATSLPDLDYVLGDFEPAFASGTLNYTAAFAFSERAFALHPRVQAVSRALHLRDAEGVFRQVSPGATLAAGNRHFLALRADGAVVAWGENSYGQIQVPAAALAEVVAVAAGGNSSLALKSDGSVVAWGSLSGAPATLPPQTQSGVIAIAGGDRHALALLTNGSVVALGGIGPSTIVPAAAQAGIVAIAAGADHSLALTNAGGVVGWGFNSAAYVPDAAQSGVVAIAANLNYSLALKADGTLVCWGSFPYFPPTSLNRIVGIAAGPTQILTLRDDGQILIWGSFSSAMGTIPAGTSGTVALAVGDTFAAALQADGSLVGWGAPAMSIPAGVGSGLRLPAAARLPIPVGSSTLELRATASGDRSPNRVPYAAGSGFTVALDSGGVPITWGSFPWSPPLGTSGLVALAAGQAHTLGLRADGSVLAWGQNFQGQSTLPGSLAGLPSVAVAAGGNFSVALSRTGAVITWGNFLVPTPAAAQSGVQAIAAGGEHVLALTRQGAVVAWGNNNYGQTTVATAAQSGVVAIAAGSFHSAALKNDRTVLTWGRDSTLSGEPSLYRLPLPAVRLVAGDTFTAILLSNGDVMLEPLPLGNAVSVVLDNVPPGALSGVRDLVAGTNHLTVFKTDGSVRTWGGFSANSTNVTTLRSGPPGDAYTFAVTRAAPSPELAGLRSSGGELSPSFTPTGLAYTQSLPSTARAITLAPAASESLSGLDLSVNGGPVQRLALGASLDGGYAYNLGLTPHGSVTAWGSTSYGIATIPAAAQSGVVAVAAGYDHALALKADGTVVAWGNTAPMLIPPAAANHDVTAIAAGGGFSAVLKRNGSVVPWGFFSGSVPVGAQSGVVAIDAGYNHLLALKSDGSVVAWGSTGGSTPSTVSSGVTAIAAGRDFSLALKDDGSVVAWGTSNYFLSTVPVSIGKRAVAIAAGEYHALVLLNDGSLVTWGNTSGNLSLIPSAATRVIAIAAGGQHSSALREDGSVVTWGAFSSQSAHTEIRLAAPRHARLPLRTGENHVRLRTIAAEGVPLAATPIVAGRERNWVLNHLGQFDFRPATSSSSTSAPPPSNTYGNSAALASGGLGDYSVRFDGTIATLRGPNPPSDFANPFTSGDPALRPRAIRVAVDQNSAIALLENRTLRAWGSVSNVSVIAETDILAIAAGRAHLLALRANGGVVTWSASLSSSHPVLQIPAAARSGVIAVAGGEGFSLALKASGTLVAWGDAFPILNSLPAGSDFVAIAAGDRHAVALRRDGTVVAWGENFSGQTSIPAAAQSGVVEISAAAHHTLALKTDGTVVTWGNNAYPIRSPSLLTAPIRAYTVLASRAPAIPALASLTSSVGEFTPAFAPETLSYGRSVPFATSSASLAALPAESGQLQLRLNGSPFQRATQGPSLALGAQRAIGISNDGAAVAWGSNVFDLNIPSAVASSDLTAIALGTYHVLALRADGSPMTWGYNAAPSALSIPGSALSGLVAVAARGGNSLVLRRDGSVVGWGQESFVALAGQNFGTGNTAIALGTYHALALKANGSVVTWGTAPTPPPEVGSGVVAIAAGNEFSLALKNDGSVFAWGGPSRITSVPTAAQSGVIAIAAGERHALALRADGSLVTWGESNASVLSIPSQAVGMVAAIAAGVNNSAVLKTDGTVVQWGDIYYSSSFRPTLATPIAAPLPLREGLNRIDLRVTPVPTRPIHEATFAAGSVHNLVANPTGLSPALLWPVSLSGSPFGTIPMHAQAGVTSVYARYNRLVALRFDGSVVNVSSGPSVPATLQPGYLPDINLPIPARAVALALASSETLTLRADGSVFAWQNDSAVPSSARTGVAAIAANRYDQLFAVRTDGRLVQWNISGTLAPELPVATQRDVIGIAAATEHGLVLKTNGTLFAWRYASPLTSDALTQIPVGAIDIVAIAAADNHFIALKRDGTVVSWGFESTLNTLPAEAQSGVVALAAGPAHALALRADGTLVPWGRALSTSGPLQSTTVPGLLTDPIRTYTLVVDRAPGQPGLAHLSASAGALSPAFAPDTLAYTLPATPYTAATLPGLVRAPLGQIETRVGSAPFAARLPGPTVAVAPGVVFALTPAGGVQAFGDSLTSGNIDVVPTAAQSEVLAIAAGIAHVVALKRDGSLVAWGSNSFGQLAVPSGNDFVSVAAGDYHTLALTSSGRVVAWGQGFAQQLLVPAAATEVVSIAAGESTSMALRRDGSVVAWGRNSSTPQTIPLDAQSGVIAIAAGRNHYLALRSDGRVVEWGSLSYPSGLAPSHGIVAIVAHRDQNLALHADGRLHNWGGVSFLPPTIPVDTPADLATLAMNDTHAAALRADGSLFVFDRGGPNLSQFNTTATFAGPFALPLGARQALALGANTLELRFTRFDAALPAVTYAINIERLPAPSIRIGAGSGADLANANPYLHDFGPVRVGLSSAAQRFTLRNTGTADLVVSGLAINGPAAADFAVSGLTPPFTVAPGAELPFTATITPAAAGYRFGFILLDANVPPQSTEGFVFRAEALAVATEIDTWRDGRFSAAELADPALEATVWGDLADPDGDGLPNLLEYALALDPRATSSAAPAQMQVDDPAEPDAPPSISYTYTRLKRAVAAGLVYRIEVSDTLAPDSWSPLVATEEVVAQDTTTETVRVTTLADQPALFLRLRVIAP